MGSIVHRQRYRNRHGFNRRGIPQATIVAVNTATNGRTVARTDAAGNYTILQLSPGTYTLEISAPGFKKLLRGSVVLEVQQQVRADSMLTVGDVAETVTVSENASRLETLRVPR